MDVEKCDKTVTTEAKPSNETEQAKISNSETVETQASANKNVVFVEPLKQ